MKRVLIILLALLVVSGGAYVATGHGPGAAQPTSPTPTTGPVRASGKITAEGKVVPVRNVQLAIPTGGTVAQVLVEEGQKVKSGDVLVRLDRTRAEAAVSQAQAGLDRARAHVAEVEAAPRKEDVAAAQAAVDAAKAQLAKLQEASRPEDVKAAEAALAAARASLTKVQQGPDSDVVAAAKNELSKLKAGATAEELKAAKLAFEQAKSTLWSTQTSRDGICGSAPAQYQCTAADAQVSAAEIQVTAAQNTLTQVAAGPRAEDVATAQARLDKLMQGATAADVANAQAQVAAAQARLDTLKTPVRQSDLDAAQAEIRRATAQVAVVEAPPRPETIAAAQADVAAAQATLEEAKIAVSDLELKAPFAGVVANLDLRPGEFVQPGVSFLSLADTTAWQVETTDLTELNVTRVHEGQAATLTFGAIPDLVLPARVTRIKELGAQDRGDILYTVTIRPDKQDDRLLWNMTAAVSIEP